MKAEHPRARVQLRLWLCCCVLLTLQLPASAFAEGPSAPEDAVSPQRFTGFSSANFLQTRHLEALDRPLVSSGSINITSSGFVWTQTVPFENVLIFDGETITETTRVGGQEISRTLEDPITTNITRTLYGMMTGTWADIQGYFEIIEGPPGQDSRAAGSWSRVLIPRDPEFDDVIPEITLSGSEFLERIGVKQKEGALTVIELSDHLIPR